VRETESLDFNGKGLGGGMAGIVAGGNGVSGCFGGTYVYAAGIRGPDGEGRRVERDLLSVGYAITKLGGLTATDGGIALKRLDGELRAAHLLDGFLILFVLFLCGRVASALFDVAIFVPAGKNNPADVDGDEEKNCAAISERIFPNGFLVRRGRRVHERLLRFGGRIHRAADVAPGN